MLSSGHYCWTCCEVYQMSHFHHCDRCSVWNGWQSRMMDWPTSVSFFGVRRTHTSWKPADVEQWYMYCPAKCLCYIYCKTFGWSCSLCWYLVFSWKILLKLLTSMGKSLMEMSMVH